MSGSLNKVMIIGHLGRDPEIKTLPSGGRVASMRVATTETWKSKDTQERQEKTEWHSVSCFGDGLVNIIEKYVKKGTKVYVEGALQTRRWTDNESGQEKFFTEIVIRGFQGQLIMMGGRNEGGALQDSYTPSRQQVASSAPASSSGGSGLSADAAVSDIEDEIPF